MKQTLNWLDSHYYRVMDTTLFVGMLVIGISIAYAPAADSMAFIERSFQGVDNGILAWVFFILPSPVYLLRGAYVLKFAALAPLAYVLGSISWFLLITPNRSWFLVPVFILSVTRMCIHYIHLIAEHRN